MAAEVTEETVRDLHAKIGELTLENDLYEEVSVKGAKYTTRPLDNGRRAGLEWAGRSARVGHAIQVASTYIRRSMTADHNPAYTLTDRGRVHTFVGMVETPIVDTTPVVPPSGPRPGA